MPKSIRTKQPPTPVLSEPERFVLEAKPIVYVGPEKGTHAFGRRLKPGEVIRCWPEEAAAKIRSTLFREATLEEAAAHEARCCPACGSGHGECLATASVDAITGEPVGNKEG